ncbi:uncharacterized protein L3040_006801 [Drepanopeziza brunnea f. sp. 'multigermtubi']|uniref:Uncharacterized protein n=1 Tax=Marssonina brunnea f. sp. multigermtubi (strain MB_m1) TaxID=1072389 RepID=K1Y2L8_MARBU|nr:uncharacterized protein MBM_02651 [Drepanopeziza brunnea f. sp. 'multigermtubi' MB_m1]EKD19414.1 hypothetical protein MBM_02651 [Drepanopeziza brunnea f. sp. 'multigermtubi' MB_m1]KAJ5037925.1 hypothetical protein L3040_006801 [Drepanopeziza brunnea f. sp. 'multigermtubi']
MSAIVPLTFPAVFPAEIREQIYDLVLVSPSGQVNLKKASRIKGVLGCFHSKIQPIPPGASPQGKLLGEIRLSFLRTCKMVHKECRNRFWAKNTLHYASVLQGAEWFYKLRTLRLNPTCLHYSLTENLQFVRFEIDFFTEGAEKLEELLFTAGQWAKEGKLQTITLVAAGEDRGTAAAGIISMASINKISTERYSEDADMKEFHAEYRQALSDPASTCLKGVSKYLHFNTTGPTIKFGNEFPEETMDAKERTNIYKFLRELSKIWDGDVLVDGVTYFRCGVAIPDTKLFEGDLIEEEIVEKKPAEKEPAEKEAVVEEV